MPCRHEARLGRVYAGRGLN